MRRFLMFILIISIVIYSGVTAYARDDSKVNIDRDTINSGYLKIGYTSDSTEIIKVMIQKDDSRYVYNLRNDGVQESYPLQMGNGDYKITVLQNIEGNSYSLIYNETINLNISDPKIVFLNSVQNINWDLKMKAIKKAQQLTKGLKSDKDKIAAIYNYIVPNFKYDFSKYYNVDKLPNPYIPVIDKTYDEHKGICYDYSSLFASMLRSVNIPVKLDMGYSKNVKEYHAWNEVYSSDLKKWLVVDTTYDSQVKAAKMKYSMAKNTKLYSAVKSY